MEFLVREERSRSLFDLPESLEALENFTFECYSNYPSRSKNLPADTKQLTAMEEVQGVVTLSEDSAHGRNGNNYRTSLPTK